MKIYIIEGGIGRQIMFSALIPALAERDGEQIMTMSPYSNIFENNPFVYRSLGRGTPFAWEDYIQNDNHEVVYCDPYFDDKFIKRKCHVLESWCRQLGIEYKQEMMPQLYLPEAYYIQAAKFKEEHGKFIITQFCSGQSPLGQDMTQPYTYSGFERNYPLDLAQEFVEKFNEQYPDVKILMYGLPNEGYHIEGTFSLNADYLYYGALLEQAETFAGVNSSLMHIAGSMGKEGVVLWGATSPAQWGYDMHTHISGECSFNNLHCSKPYLRDLGDYTSSNRWSCSKPTCMRIPSDDIIGALKI